MEVLDPARFVTTRPFVPREDEPDWSPAWDEPAPPPRPKPQIIRPADLQGASPPPRTWVVPNWIPDGVVTGLYGDGGLGKTLLAQQLQTAAALGQLWVGLETARVRSLGVYCEDAKDELWRRQDQINAHYEVEMSDLEALRWMPRFGDENLLITFTSRGAPELTAFHHEVTEAALDLKSQLVIIDTVADTFGGNENDRGQVRQYVSGALGKIARAIDGAVVCCAHPSRTGLSSGEGDGGSTGWSAAFRSRLFLHAPAAEDGAVLDPDARILSRKKANYATRLESVDLRWRHGALVPASTTSAGTNYKRPVEHVFLDFLDEMTAQNRPVSDSANAPNFAPKLFTSRPGSDGWRRKDFERAMESLFLTRKIEMREYGRKSDLRRKIVRVEASE